MAKVNVEQRIQAVQRYLNGDVTMIEIAEDIGVTDIVISEWVRRYQKNGVETFLKSYTKYSADYKMNVLNYINDEHKGRYGYRRIAKELKNTAFIMIQKRLTV